jgi:hypothetical protein
VDNLFGSINHGKYPGLLLLELNPSLVENHQIFLTKVIRIFSSIVFITLLTLGG